MKLISLSSMEILYLAPLIPTVVIALLILNRKSKQKHKFIVALAISLLAIAIGIASMWFTSSYTYYVVICSIASCLLTFGFVSCFQSKDAPTADNSNTENGCSAAPSIINTNQPNVETSNPLMTRCSVCGREIAKSAKVCPGCGAKNRQLGNKKFRPITIIVAIIVVALLAFFVPRLCDPNVGFLGINIKFGGNNYEVLTMGDTFTADGVSFTFNDFCFAERTDGETYDPNMIDGVAFAPNDGYVFAYINYTIDNGGKEAFSHFMDMDVLLEYNGYTYGESQLDYKATCTEEDKYNLDIDPLMSKTYHHIITNFPRHLAEGIVAEYNSAIYVTVNLGGKTAKFIVPHNAATTINPGQEKPAEDISFTEADEATKQFVSGILMQNTYTWQNGNIDCQLTFDSTQAQLTQNMAGTNFVSTGEYVIGTDKIKVNYGGGDVFYGWTKNGDSIDLHLIE